MDWHIIGTIAVVLGVQLLIFITGIILGKFMCIYNISVPQELSPTKSIFSQAKKPKDQNINIDETKIVGQIQTNNLEKKFSSLANEKEIVADLGSSINKLKNMKG